MSSSSEDNGGAYESSQLGATLVISIIITSVLYTLFEVHRGMRRIYMQRRTKALISTHRVPAVPPRHVFGWLTAIACIGDDEVLRMAGLDAYMLLRYAQTCFKIALVFTALGAVIFVPIYSSAGGETEGRWNKFTLSNVPDDPHSLQLWAPAVVMYFLAAYFCLAMGALYRDFFQRRLQYLRDGDPDTPQQTYYTVMVEGIPPQLRSAPKFRAFFEQLFPGQVYGVQMTLDLSELETCVQRRSGVRNQLERAVAVWEATGVRPRTWVSPSRARACSHPQHAPLPPALLPRLLGRDVYDAVDQLCLELQALNSLVAALQAKYHAQTLADGTDEACLDQSHGTYGKMEMGIKRTLASFKHAQVAANVLAESGSGDSLLDHDSLAPMKAAAGAAPAGGASQGGACSAAAAAAAAAAGINPSARPAPSSEAANPLQSRGVQAAAHINETLQNAAKGVLRSAANIERQLELLTVGAYYQTATTGFVTFTSRVAHCMAHQMLLSHDHVVMRAQPAPNPRDILWRNIAVPLKQLSLRKDTAGFGLVFGAIFWSLVVTFITTISNLQDIQKSYPWLEKYSNTFLYQFCNSYLTSLLLLICIAILPLIFDLVARQYEGLKLESEIQNSIMKRYFYYQLANVFVSVGFGSIAASLAQFFDQPRSILSILGNNIPAFSIYFANLLIVKGFTTVPIELLRTWPLVLYLSVRMCLNEKKCSWRDLRTGVFSTPILVYGWIYPSLLMVLMIITTYSCIAPLLMPFGMIYYGLVYAMYKYQVLYVYVNAYQSGGYMWYAVFRRSMVALLMSVMTLICYMAIRIKFVSGPFYVLLPLPLCIIRFWSVCEGQYKEHSKMLSLEGATKLDEQAAELAAVGGPTPLDSFRPDLFLSSSLVEGEAKPAPYRRKGLVHKKSRGASDVDSILREDDGSSRSYDSRTLAHLLSPGDSQDAASPPLHAPDEDFVADDPEGEVELEELFSWTCARRGSKAV